MRKFHHITLNPAQAIKETSRFSDVQLVSLSCLPEAAMTFSGMAALGILRNATTMTAQRPAEVMHAHEVLHTPEDVHALMRRPAMDICSGS